MKRILPALIAVLALAAGGAAVYFYQKPGALPFLRAALGVTEARTAVASYLPGDTITLLSLPDPAQSAADWKTTDLYKIWLEPEVQAFLARPLSKIPPHQEFDDVLARLAKLDPKNLFIALTSLEEKTNQPHILAGFQFKGSSTEVDHLLAPAKDAMRKSEPAGKADLLNYQGRSIETFDAGEGKQIASVYYNDWYLVGNDVNLLKATLDRFEGRANKLPALDKDADFTAAVAKLPAGQETLIFTRFQPFASRVFDLAAASGQAVSAEQRAETEKVKAIVAGTRIDNGKLRDTIYFLAPGLKQQELPKLQMGSLPLTTGDTLLYAAAVVKWPEASDLPSAANPGAAMFDSIAKELAAKGLTMDGFRAAFGSEPGLQLDWPSGEPQPGLILSLDVRDHAAADKFLAGLIAASQDAGWQKTAEGKTTYYSVNVPNVPSLNPTLTLTDKHLVLGLTSREAHAAVGREAAGGGALAQTDGYKTAAGTVGKPNVATAYLNTRVFFERIYGLLKSPMVLGSVAMFAPQSGEYLDLSKLPATETIAKHLSPMAMSEAIDSQGLLLESVGTITFAQTVLGVGGGAGLSYFIGSTSKTELQPPADKDDGNTDQKPSPDAQKPDGGM